MPPGATDASVQILKNVVLRSADDNNSAASTDEPSVATNGDLIFYTGNWYAALSTDGGATFHYVDPFHAFPDPPGMGFCCDQVVQYVPAIDTFIWLLQYTADANNENVQRLAFATSAQVPNGQWQTFDITPQLLGLANTMLDFPDLAVGANMLYFTTNAFDQTQQWVGSHLVRMPLAGIVQGTITADHTTSNETFNFRVAQHCSTRAYAASHVNTSTLRLYAWDEGAPTPTFTDLTVAQWAEGSMQSVTPDGFNWLGRADSRVLGATLVGTELWFSWGSNAGGANGRPHPFTQVARIDSSTLTVLDNLNLWDPGDAIAYAALESNDVGEVGVSYMFGGGDAFPSHAVGLLTGTVVHTTTAQGAHGPEEQRWGDYLTIRRHHPDGHLFAATGYTLQQGSTRLDGTPRFVLFERANAGA
jgi:hypothetical protein